ncbi:MAG: hypothetical protein ACRYG8_16460 [Janthinobacterium lividum]
MPGAIRGIGSAAHDASDVSSSAEHDASFTERLGTARSASPGVEMRRTENVSDQAKGWSRISPSQDGKNASIPELRSRKGERLLYASVGPKQPGSREQAFRLANVHANATSDGKDGTLAGRAVGTDQVIHSGLVSSGVRTLIDEHAVHQKDAKKGETKASARQGSRTQWGDPGYPSATGTSTSVGMGREVLPDLRQSGFKPDSYSQTSVPTNHGVISSGRVVPLSGGIGGAPGRTSDDFELEQEAPQPPRRRATD